MAQREILTQYCFGIHDNSYHYKNVFKLQGGFFVAAAPWAELEPLMWLYQQPIHIYALMAQLFGCWEQNIPWTRAKIRDSWKKNPLDCLISVSQEKQTNKKNPKESNIKNPHTQKFPNHIMKNKWTKQSKTNTKENKQTNTTEQSSKTTKEKPICQNLWLFVCILKHLHLKIKSKKKSHIFFSFSWIWSWDRDWNQYFLLVLMALKLE